MPYETEITVQLTPLGTLQSTDVITIPSSTAVFSGGGTLGDLSDVNLSNVNPRDVLTYIDANTGWSNRPIDVLSLPANAVFTSIVANTILTQDLNISGSINRSPTITVNLLGDVSGSASATLSNLGDGTIDIVTTVIGGGSGGVNTGYVDAKAGNAYSNAVLYTNTMAATAYANAVANSSSFANTRANQAYTNAVAYADTRAGIAYSNAVLVASADATNKAAIAYGNAIAYAASNTYVNQQLNLKANLASPIFTGTVSLPRVSANASIGTAGQVLTSNGDGVYWSTPSTGSGNADQAYSNAISVAAADATTKANQAYSNAVTYTNSLSATAYSNAVSVASADATTKANQAYSNAVSVAAADATTKANQAYSNSVTHADNMAAVAYANAVTVAATDASNKANAAYSNAIAYAASNTYVNQQLTLKANTANPSFTGNVTINTLVANGSTGSIGQILHSNGTAIYWASPAVANGSVGTLDQVLAAGNTTTKSLTVGPLNVNGNITVAAGRYVDSPRYLIDGAAGLPGYVLAANGGGNSYWRDLTTELNEKASNSFVVSALSSKANTASPTFTGTTTVGSLTIGNSVTANGSTGSAGQVLTSNGTGTYWSTPAAGGGFTNGQSISVNNFISVGNAELRNTTIITNNNSNRQFTVFSETIGSNVFTVTSANVVVRDAPLSLVGSSLIDFSGNSGIQAGGSRGSNGQVLTSNGSAVYWSTPTSSTNTSAVYVWTNNHTFSGITNFTNTVSFTGDTTVSGNLYVDSLFTDFTANVLFLDAVRLAGNTRITGSLLDNLGSVGSNGQVLTSDGAKVRWQTIATGGFTNGQSISVANLAVTGSFTANGSTGSAGQVLTSNGTATYWSSPAVSNGSVGTLDQVLAAGNSSTLGMTVGPITANGTLTIRSSVSANGSTGSAGQVLTTNGTGVYWSTVSTSNGSASSLDDVLAIGNTTTKALTVGPLTTPRIQRLVTTINNASAVVTHDLNQSSLFYHNNPIDNFVVNFTNTPTTGTATTVRLVVSQGSLAALPTTVQIAGIEQDIAWADGVVPAGNPNQYDLVTFELINIGTSWIVFGKLETWATIQELQDAIPRGDYETGNESFDLQTQVALTLDLNI